MPNISLDWLKVKPRARFTIGNNKSAERIYGGKDGNAHAVTTVNKVYSYYAINYVDLAIKLIDLQRCLHKNIDRCVICEQTIS